jgi:hypothetical protein
VPPDPGTDQARLHGTADPKENHISSYFSDITLVEIYT